jgi:hypothetical protein
MAFGMTSHQNPKQGTIATRLLYHSFIQKVQPVSLLRAELKIKGQEEQWQDQQKRKLALQLSSKTALFSP